MFGLTGCSRKQSRAVKEESVALAFAVNPMYKLRGLRIPLGSLARVWRFFVCVLIGCLAFDTAARLPVLRKKNGCFLTI
ncbi:hypothetical protein SDC9_204643 [bioreactor metagenome]|uniref:Uncharacterized protein n=1 Tax=bioreactor metagenome TaxID=1076179 RepID=A0A645J1A7_9ZZZZ